MVENSLKELVNALSITPLSTDVLQTLTHLLENQNSESFSSFISQSFQSLLTLEQWAWKSLSYKSHQWINQSNYIHLLHSLASFNKNLILKYDHIDDEIKASLLIPDNIDQINSLFEQLNQYNYNNNSFYSLISLWFDNLSLFIHDSPQFSTNPIICYINQYVICHYLMTDQFKFYLIQLDQSNIPSTIFSNKQLFYIKTCSHLLASYISPTLQNLPLTYEEIFRHVGNEYLKIVINHSRTIELWTEELLACITHLTGFIHACFWFSANKLMTTKILLPTEEIAYDYAQSLIRIISYKLFYKKIEANRSNSETILIDTVLKTILLLLHVLNMKWVFRSNLTLTDTLLTLADVSAFDEISICAYAVIGEILIDEKLKELKITDKISNYFYCILELAWHHPLKRYKQIPVDALLRGYLRLNIYRLCKSLFSIFLGFSPLTKNDIIQQKIAKDSHKLIILIEMCDTYPIVLDILWALSFNQDIQNQLRSNILFMSKLSRLAEECDNEKMKKIIHGLLWNLENHDENRSTSEINGEKTFDIMISYSHKDKVLCQQIYDELIKVGYHVWIDFDQMHGNVMDAMAQAIEQSQTIIICMSESYRNSNYCRAEAQYAFRHQRKIVPVLLEKHYRPDGWLLFLIGQILYIDFIKYEFSRAMIMLLKELKNTDSIKSTKDITQTLAKLCLSPILPKNIFDWTQTHVQGWLTTHNLIQMSHLFIDFNGRSLLYFDDYIRNCDRNQILNLLQKDSVRRTGQDLSLTELCHFQSLMDEQKQSNISPTFSSNTNPKPSFICCRLM